VEVSQSVTYQCEKEDKLKTIKCRTTSQIIFLRDLYAVTSSPYTVEVILIILAAMMFMCPLCKCLHNV
jgi:hypothetical protein